MKVVCIMQARVGSSRLPGKVLEEICGKTVIEHDINILKLVPNIDEIIIATTLEEQDDKIVDKANKLGVKYFRGSESDVLSRYYFSAKESNADVVVRVTSDCPCMDSRIIENIINEFKKCSISENIDYISNTVERTFPRGYDVEVFKFQSLEKAFLSASKDYEREHVTPYIYDLNNKFKISSYKHNVDCSKYRVTLDTQEDLQVIKAIYEELFNYKGYFSLQDVLGFLDKNPNIARINEEIEQKKLGE